MVSMTLLALIMVGLLTMFNQTQKALHLVNAQTDVFENARGAIQIITRDLAETTVFGGTNVAIYASSFPSPVPGGVLPLFSGNNQFVDFTEAFWLTRANDEWRGIGYLVLDDSVLRTNYGVGTLYRFTGQVREESAPDLFTEFTSRTSPTNTHRISDGIVHFSMQAVYVTNNNVTTNFGRASSFLFSNVLPAFIDVELGVLEPATLKQFQALSAGDFAAGTNFLARHAGNIHFFRERVPLRNFINPHRAHEVP